MLYRSTRNKLDSYTPYRTLSLDRGSDGGFILPLQFPFLEIAQIEQMKGADFLQNVADVLNLFFGTEFTAWDIESTVGKTPLKTVECGQNTVICQCWKNPAGDLNYFMQSIFSRLYSVKGNRPTTWARVAIRISLIAATALCLTDQDNTAVDIAVNSGDFEQAFAACYCRKMGFPIRKILIACNENSGIWDFVYRGTLNCGMTLQKTAYPDMDRVVPDLLEAYLFLKYGECETLRFVEALNKKAAYQLPEDAEIPADDNLFVSVVGQDRIPTVISSFHSTSSISVHPYTAFSLGALQDYRAKAGESCLTVIFEENAPKI